MTSRQIALKRIPDPVSIVTILSLTDHGTTGAITGAGAARFDLRTAEEYHEGLLQLQVKTEGGKGGTPTAVGANKTFTVYYGFSDDVIDVSDVPNYFADDASRAQLVCDLPDAISVRATSTLTFVGNAVDGDRVKIGDRQYVFYDIDIVTGGNGGLGYQNGVVIGATATDTAQNLVDAINLTGTPGTQYHEDMAANAQITAASGGAGVVSLTAIAYGAIGNTYVTTEILDDGSNFSFTGASFAGGSSSGTRLFKTELFVHGGRYLYVFYDRTAFAANALIDVTAKISRR